MKNREITEEEIESQKTLNGGWTRTTLAQWGVPWPPPKGWKAALIERGTPFQDMNCNQDQENRYGRDFD